MSRLLPKKTVQQLRALRAVRRRRQEVITSFKMTYEMRRKLRDLAKKMDRTQSWIMREAVESYLTYHTAKKKVEHVDADSIGNNDDSGAAGS